MEANVPVENKKNLLGELQKPYLEKLQRAAETTRTGRSKIPNSKGYNRCRGELAFVATPGALANSGYGPEAGNLDLSGKARMLGQVQKNW